MNAPTRSSWQTSRDAERAAVRARAAVARPCRDCGAPTLAGLDDDTGGSPATADDPADRPVTYLQAVAAVLAGRGVYAVASGDLHRLDDMQLSAGGPQMTLALEHHCQPNHDRPVTPPASEPALFDLEANR